MECDVLVVLESESVGNPPCLADYQVPELLIDAPLRECDGPTANTAAGRNGGVNGGMKRQVDMASRHNLDAGQRVARSRVRAGAHIVLMMMAEAMRAISGSMSTHAAAKTEEASESGEHSDSERGEDEAAAQAHWSVSVLGSRRVKEGWGWGRACVLRSSRRLHSPSSRPAKRRWRLSAAHPRSRCCAPLCHRVTLRHRSVCLLLADQ